MSPYSPRSSRHAYTTPPFICALVQALGKCFWHPPECRRGHAQICTLLALEALGRVCNLPLRLGSVSELSYASLLRASGPFLAHRPPLCDGAGAPSSADHSLPHQSNISKASQAWLRWAHKSDLPKRVFAHISQSRPDHPLSAEEQSQALEIQFFALP